MADETEQRNPFKNRGFIVATAVVAVLVIVGAVVIINALTKPKEPAISSTQTPQPSASAAPTAPTAETGGVSVCGLNTVKMSGTLNAAPEAQWAYLDTITFPVSKVSGPGNSDTAKTMNCFERTPQGAVFAAAAGMAQLSSPNHKVGWIKANVTDGPVKNQMLASAQSNSSTDDGQSRATFSGFKLLSYDGKTARVDLGVTGAGKGKTIYLSMIVPLVWENGDWKMDFTESDMRSPAQLPNLAGYALWKE